MYLQAPALLSCKAGAARLLKIIIKNHQGFGALLPSSTISKDFKPSVCCDKRSFVQLPENLGIWCWQEARGVVFAGVFAHKNPLKQQKAGKMLEPREFFWLPWSTPDPARGLRNLGTDPKTPLTLIVTMEKIFTNFI